MKGYESTAGEVTTGQELVEDKVVLEWDPEAEGWVITRTRVLRHTVTTTERLRASQPEPDYPRAALRARDEHDGLPVYVRGDDRDRAQREADEYQAARAASAAEAADQEG